MPTSYIQIWRSKPNKAAAVPARNCCLYPGLPLLKVRPGRSADDCVPSGMFGSSALKPEHDEEAEQDEKEQEEAAALLRVAQSL